MHIHSCPQCQTDKPATHIDGALTICDACDGVCERVQLCETCEVRECCGSEAQCLTCIAADAVSTPSTVAGLLLSTKAALAQHLAYQLYFGRDKHALTSGMVPVTLRRVQAG
jgi:hypothetical protein